MCSMGGLVVKQMLYQAKADNMDEFVNNTIGVVCVFGSSNRMGFTYAASTSFCFCLITVFPWFRRFIAALILAANLRTCPGEWVLCFALHPLLVTNPTYVKNKKKRKTSQKYLVGCPEICYKVIVYLI